MIARRIPALLVIGSFWLTFTEGLAAPVPKQDVVKRAADASRASAEAIRSGADVVTFESYLQEREEKEARLWAKGRVKVYFKDEKYHFRFNYETKQLRTTYLDEQGKKKGERIAEWKPDDLAIIFDGTAVREVKFSQRIHPSGCQIEIRDSLRNTPSVVKDDLTRLWLEKVGMESVVKTMKREAIHVTDLGGGNFRLRYQLKALPRIRVEIDVSSKANYNPTRLRVLDPTWDRNCEECSAKWKKTGDIWYVEDVGYDPQNSALGHAYIRDGSSVYRSESFEPNAKVDPQLFTLNCLKIPPKARIFDRRPQEKR